jgi:hypothetical protein
MTDSSMSAMEILQQLRHGIGALIQFHAVVAAERLIPMPLKRASRQSLLLSVFLCLLSDFCSGQTPGVVCSGGIGSFQVKFLTGVTVSVGAARTGKLANRACAATLGWEKQDLEVAHDAAEVDIDVLGVDFGLGTPVVAFQVKKSGDISSSVEYQIYSLHKPPGLLRTIVGKDFFSAADTDIDGRIEIWANDAGAVDGFEGLPLGALDFAPTAVLRFENHRLVDVSSQFLSYFNDRIGEVRARLDVEEVADFKNSDGKLSGTSTLRLEQLLRLRSMKIKVLEIVWSYLYSGREQEAWRELSSLWPAVDVDRIRASLLNARAHGIRAQVDGFESTPDSGPKKSVIIYNTPSDDAGRPIDPSGAALTTDIRPQAILLRRPAPQDFDQALTQSEEMVYLVLDAAGKVRSAEPVGKADPELINACAKWKFIPAFKDGRAVASHMRFAVSLRR